MKIFNKACRNKIFSLITALVILPIYSEAIKIASWNILNFPGTTGSAREDDFRMVIDQLNLDILVVQEMTSQFGVYEYLNNIMNYSSPGKYEAANYYDGPDTDNALFFDKSKIKLISQQQLPTTLRDISEYVLEIRDGIGKGAIFRIYSLHLKSGSASSDKSERTREASVLREYLNGLPPNSLIVVCGDFNLESSFEPSYEILIGNQADNDGRLKDPINRPGDWNDNINYADIHTQSTRVIQFGGGASGGLDDRFDFILISYALETSSELQYKNGSYYSYGNDGEHFNKAINGGINKAVDQDAANALYEASDHLPIVIELEPPQKPYYSLGIGSSSGGTTAPPSGSYSYENGTKVNVVAIPNIYFGFSGWIGDVAGAKKHDNEIELIMDSDKNIVANFIRNIYEPLFSEGQRILNRSLSQIEYINRIRWKENPNNINIQKYRVYIFEASGQKLLAELGSNTLEYLHRKVNINKPIVYAVYAVNDAGREGNAAIIEIR